MAQFIAEQNLSLATADKFTKIVKQMFPDSKIAQRFQCGRSKTTCIVKELAKSQQASLVQKMKTGPFSLSTDGSNDEKSKQFPLVVRCCGSAEGNVSSELYSVPVCEGSATGENIFHLIRDTFEEKQIPWGNCISFGTDNAHVMTGHKKGVFAFLKEKHGDIHLAGCTLHLVHIAAEKGADCLPASVDDILVDIHYYLKKSSKRQQDLGQFQDFYGVEHHKILKHVCTRWLSITRCVERLLSNWSALKEYFKTQKCVKSSGSVPSTSANSNAQEKAARIVTFLRSPTNKLYCYFLKYVQKSFDPVLLDLQSDEPKVHVLRRKLLGLVRDLLVKVCKPSALSMKPVLEVQYTLSYNQKADKDLLIGSEATTFIADRENNGLREEKIQEFYSNVRKYFVTTLDYLIKKLPFQDKVLSAAEIADVKNKEDGKQSSLVYLLNRFPALIPPSSTTDTLLEEYSLFLATDTTCCVADRMDDTWAAIGQLSDGCGTILFANLAACMKGLLTIPHSNAHCERIFSVVRKNKTDQRSCLGDNTLEALLVLKNKCGPHDLDDDSLRQIKGAYHRSLQK